MSEYEITPDENEDPMDDFEDDALEPVHTFCYSNSVEIEAVRAYADDCSYPLEEFEAWCDEFEEAYCGVWSSGGEYAQDCAESMLIGDIDLDQWPLSCIDWEQAWNELKHDGYWEHNSDFHHVYIFRIV